MAFSSFFLFPQEYLVVVAGDDADPTSGRDIYTGFSLSSSGEYLGFYDPAGNLLSEFSVGGGDYPAQIPDVSYGLIDSGNPDSASYFSTPTPGATNANPVLGIVDRVTSSVTPGFFDAPFNVTLSTTSVGANIRYTLDGSTPTATNGFNYTGPINISGSETRCCRFLLFRLPLTRTICLIHKRESMSTRWNLESSMSDRHR